MRTLGNAAVSAALAAALAGCGAANDCAQELAKVDAVPSSCPALQAGETISFALQFCATCPQTSPTCVPVYDQVAAGVIQLEPYVAVCDPNATSCAPQQACSYACRFQAPTVPGPYQVLVIDSTGTAQSVPVTVVAQSGAMSCG